MSVMSVIKLPLDAPSSSLSSGQHHVWQETNRKKKDGHDTCVRTFRKNSYGNEDETGDYEVRTTDAGGKNRRHKL